MTDNLVVFPGVADIEKPVELQAVPNVIRILEECLEEAQAGKIESIAIAISRPWKGINCRFSETGDAGRILGAMALLRHRMLIALERDDEEELEPTKEPA